jgi:hypothetical protein
VCTGPRPSIVQFARAEPSSGRWSGG